MQKVLFFIVTATAFFLVSCQATYSPAVPPMYIPARSGEVNFETGPKGIGLGLRSNANIKKGWGLTSSVEGGAYSPGIGGGAFDVGLNYVLPNPQKKSNNMQVSLTYGMGVSFNSFFEHSNSFYSYSHILGSFNYEFGNKKNDKELNKKWGLILQTGCVGELSNKPSSNYLNSFISFDPALNGYVYFRTEKKKTCNFFSYCGFAYNTGAPSVAPKLGFGLSIRTGYGKKKRNL